MRFEKELITIVCIFTDTGILTTTTVLDYDNGTTIKYHSLQVFVTDKGLNTVTVTLTIVLQPVNEPPVCTSPQLTQGTGKF